LLDPTRQSLDKIVSSILMLKNNLQKAGKQPVAAKPFPLLIMCLDYGGNKAAEFRPGWPIDFVIKYVPSHLPEALRRIGYQKQFAVMFEGPGCPFSRAVDDDLLNKQHGADRWFVWKGTLYMVGANSLFLQMDFLHTVNSLRTSGVADWRQDDTTNMDPFKVPNLVATAIREKWESYLKEVGVPIEGFSPPASRN
jgi:hypothetical protein